MQKKKKKKKKSSNLVPACIYLITWLINIKLTPFKYQFKLSNFNFKLITHYIIWVNNFHKMKILQNAKGRHSSITKHLPDF